MKPCENHFWYPVNVPLVLASRSPRRHEILKYAGIPHDQIPSGIEEIFSSDDPEKEVLIWSRKKVESVIPLVPGRPVLGADTVVSLEGKILGIPSDREVASTMLRSLSGRKHTVFGGVCLIWPEKNIDIEFTEKTNVWFRSLTDDEIRAYVETGEPMDKAGAYGIQRYGSLLVERIEGCYFNVMGLPVSKIISLFRKHLC